MAKKKDGKKIVVRVARQYSPETSCYADTDDELLNVVKHFIGASSNWKKHIGNTLTVEVEEMSQCDWNAMEETDF